MKMTFFRSLLCTLAILTQLTVAAHAENSPYTTTPPEPKSDAITLYKEKGPAGLAELSDVELFDFMTSSTAKMAITCGVTAEVLAFYLILDFVSIPVVTLVTWLMDTPLTHENTVRKSYRRSDRIAHSMNRDQARNDIDCGTKVRRVLDIADEMRLRGLDEKVKLNAQELIKEAQVYSQELLQKLEEKTDAASEAMKEQLKEVGRFLGKMADAYAKYGDHSPGPKI